MNNNQDIHPIELFLADLLSLFEGICWIINEASGSHSKPTTKEETPPTTWSGGESPQVAIEKFNEYIHGLTLKQLREVTGVKSSRYRKADLRQLAIVSQPRSLRPIP